MQGSAARRRLHARARTASAPPGLSPSARSGPVVRAGRVARLARVVDHQRAVPRADIDHLAEQGARRDLELARGASTPSGGPWCCRPCRRPSPAAAHRHGADREPAGERVVDRGGDRVVEPRHVQLAPLPARPARAEQRLGAVDGPLEAGQQRAIAGAPRMAAEPRVGCSSSSRITIGRPARSRRRPLSSQRGPEHRGRQLDEFQTSNSAAAPESGASPRFQRRSSRIARAVGACAARGRRAAGPSAPPAPSSGRPAAAASRRACRRAPGAAPTGCAAAGTAPPTRSRSCGRTGSRAAGSPRWRWRSSRAPGRARPAAVRVEEAVPLVAPVARHGQQPVPVAADRREAARLPADVAGRVGVDLVLAGRAPAAQAAENSCQLPARM